MIPFRHRHRPVSLRATAALTLATALAVAGCGGGTHHQTLPVARSAPPLQSIFTFSGGGQLLTDPDGTLDTLRGLGVNVVKLYLPWGTVAPDPTAARPPAGRNVATPAAYPSAAFAPYDAVVRAAAARGITVDLTVGGPAPQWATGPGAPPHGVAGVWRPSARAFGAFVRAVGARYSGHFTPGGATAPLPAIRFWSIWNEPNYGQYLAPQAVEHSTVEVAPALYRRLLAAAWRALQATGHGADTVLIGELAPRGNTVGDVPGDFGGMVPLRFLRALYCVNAQLQPLRGAAASARSCPATTAGSRAFAQENPALFRASGLSVHPYPQGQPPNFITPYEPDFADFGALPQLERTIDRIDDAYGRGQLPLYSTEYGYRTNPPDASLATHGVAAATAAEYMNWAEYASWADPRIRSYDQYLLTDPPGAGSYATGLLYASGAPKPTLAAFRLPLYLPVAKAAKGASVLVWGDVRPAAYLPHPQTVEIEYARSAAGPWSVVRRVTVTDPHGYFEVSVGFPASGVVRLGWSAPGGAVQHSRVATVQIG